MKAFDTGDVTVLVRVDFVDDNAWATTREAALSPLGPEVEANIVVVDDRAYDGVDFAALREPPTGYEARVLLCFDRHTREHPESPLLLIDWLGDYVEAEDRYLPRSLRVTPGHADSIAVNLTLANMDVDDFARSAKQDGIFRGFGPN